ncbi:Retrotran-gag-2 domain containing protein [Pyrenophora tritici-repentis]|uniref:Retrotran-gag-2 domain containing protein n=1 Tax=Pyrenophora tritici-repentis TaxID=45151 RepID=A0A922T3Q8_9PLEO|nr:Retrotran-gag-2 domain containing protein [Pyrenophora tritici-repentis]
MEPSTPTSPSPSNIIRLDLTSLTPSPIPTSSPTPILSPTPIQYHESPDEFVQGGITYVKRAIIARKDFRQGTSHIWKYGLQYIRDSDKKEVYYCHECRVGKSKQELFVINGTSRIRNHLEQKHQIDPQSGIKRKGSVRKSIIDQQKDGAASSIFFWKESVEKFKELLIRWIVYCHIAFFQLENQYFRELLLFLNPALLNHLPKAAKTIRSWVMNAFISKKQQLREDLHHSRSRISISFDLWTSPNPYAILGVVAMWIDTTGMRRVTALGMRRIYGEHTGENLGSVVLELLEEYDISGDQIGYFMLDNASANDTAVEFILKDLCPWMKSKQRRHRRLRCLGHVINLCCQAFLMGRNCEKYLAKLEKHHQRGDYTKVEELWKKFGCLGRLHNLVRYIRLTPQRREEFATIIIGGDLSQFDGLELIQNNSTRWNSWFYSITRALNVRERLELFSARHVPGKGSVGIANFKLDGQHWFELEKIELALKDFYAATLLSEGKKTSLADWFSTLDCLLREISETKDHYHDIHTEDDNNFTWKYLQGCADAAWLKCVEYYNNQQLNWQNRFPEDTDLPPAYYAAQILDPYRKWGWFRQEWVLHGDEEKKRWFENAQLAVKHLWETEYKGRYPVEMLPPPARKERDPDPAFDRQREHKRIRIDAPVSTTDLYEQYISTDRLHNEEAGCNEAIAYWLSRYDSQRDLARFALDMFAISPMSDECERLFSSAKLTIVDRRGPFNNEARQLLKEDKLALDLWVARDARLQNTILSSIDKPLVAQVRTCPTAHDMYKALKDLNSNGDYANAALAWTAFIDLRAETQPTVRNYIGKFRETINDITVQGITLGWKKPSAVPGTSADRDVEDLLIIHFLHGLARVLPQWVEARNNDLRQGHTWSVDTLVASLEDHLRHALDEPVKTFLSVSKQAEEKRVLTRLNGRGNGNNSN